MAKTVPAVYENGVLRPLEPLSLQEQQRVTITINEMFPEESVLDTEYLRTLEAMEIPEVSLEEVQARLSKIPGLLTADFIAERQERP